MENNNDKIEAFTIIFPQAIMKPGFEVKTADSVGKVTDSISFSHCMFCTEKIKGSKNSFDKTPYLNFENGIKSLCALFSLPGNYFHDELKVSSVLLLASLCSNCVEKLELISEYFGEIERIRTELERLKTSIEKDLSRESSQETDGDREQTLFRKRLQKKVNISLQCTSASILKQTAAPSEDAVSLGHIDAYSFFDPNSASPLNSNFTEAETEDDVYNNEAQDDPLASNYRLVENEVKQEAAEPTLFWTACLPKLRPIPSTVVDQLNQNSLTGSEEANLEKNELNSNQKLLRSGSKVTFTAFNSSSESETESETESKCCLSSAITSSTNSGLRWKPEPTLSPKELNLVESAGLKDCSIVVPRLIVPKRSRLIKGKSAKNVLTCEHCFKVCTESAHLRFHKSITHPETHPFMCVECHRGFNKETIYQRHLEFHASNLKYCCPTCKAEFVKRRDLVEHRKIHPLQFSKECEHCGKYFRKRFELLSHQRKHHGLPYPHTCSICQKGFNREDALKVHEVNHTGERNFICDQCPSTFASQTALDRHVKDMHVKHVVNMFTCELCARSYKRKGSLVMHLRTHSGERPFVCDLCGMSFVFRNKLVSHLNLHKDERPFLCAECGFSFRSKKNLRAHQKTHEKHRELMESAINSGTHVGKLPVPRLARPRNRSLGFARINYELTGTVPAAQIEPEVNSVEASDPLALIPEPETDQEPEPPTATDGQTEVLWSHFE